MTAGARAAPGKSEMESGTSMQGSGGGKADDEALVLTGPLMKGRRGLIMGVANDHSIAWGIARALAAHGAELAFTYQGESFGRRVKPLAESAGSNLLLPCDVTDGARLHPVFERLAKKRGVRDFVGLAFAHSHQHD